MKHILKQSLYRNALGLMANTILLSGFGFIFWILAARIYTAHVVGLGSTALAAMELLSALSLMGFNVALIRYIPQSKEKAQLIGSCFSVSWLSAAFLSVLFVVFIPS